MKSYQSELDAEEARDARVSNFTPEEVIAEGLRKAAEEKAAQIAAAEKAAEEQRAVEASWGEPGKPVLVGLSDLAAVFGMARVSMLPRAPEGARFKPAPKWAASYKRIRDLLREEGKRG